MTVRVAVIGSAGRMGSEAVAAVIGADGLELVAEIDEGDRREILLESATDVAIDFTHPGVVMENLKFCIEHHISAVVGTSGFDESRVATLREWLGDDPRSGVLIAPNFGIAAVLMMQFAAQAARFFASAEIVELHHPGKVDAPSGTARRTAELIGEARSSAALEPMPDATSDELPGARGAQISGVHIHSARVLGMVAHQEVIFGGPGETLTLRHDSMTRASFMPGVLIGVRQVGTHPGLTVGLEHFLDLR